jgi:hypothetical protein
MEVVTATFWHTSESRQFHALYKGVRPFGRAPFLLQSVLTEPLRAPYMPSTK